MHPQDLLPTLAEMAVTFLGFTGVLVAFRPASAGQWSKSELIRIRGILLGPSVVMVTSVLPFGLSGFSDSPSIVWGIPLVFYGLTNVALLARMIFDVRRGDYQITQGAGVALMVILALVSVLAVLSGLGAVVPFSAGLLVLALCWSLVGNAAAFVLILVVWAKTSAGNQIASTGAADRGPWTTGERE